MPSKKPAQLPDDPQWCQRPDENNLWFSRFSEYLRLGPTARSVRAVYRAEKGHEKSQSVPQSWSDAYHTFQWQSRAAAYDAWRRKEIFDRGNASDVKRIEKLDTLIDGLFERIEKMLQNTPHDEKFNGFLIDRFITAMDLMAKHTGGYVERHEHTGKDGEPIEVNGGFKAIFYLPEVEALPEQLLDAPKEEPGDAEHHP